MFTRSRLLATLSCRWIFFPAVLCLLTFQSDGAVHDVDDVSAPAVRGARELIVKFKPNARFIDRNGALKNASKVEDLDGGGQKAFRAANAAPSGDIQRLQVQEGVEVDSELARLQNNPAVEYVEPNYPIKLFVTTNSANVVIPNDFEFSKMYSLQNAGGQQAKTNADVKAPAAWRYATGDKKVVVAVIDTGVDYFHEDLVDNLWTNAGEVPFNGVDDDANGFIDDYYGYDFVSGDSDPFDDNQHGTHVAGTIGAKGNNGIGTVGICWDVSLMTLKAFDDQGSGTVADAIAAIHYAVEKGARIINASWGLEERSRALEDATKFAAESGVLFVAAAGNSHSEAPSYPASFDTVLSVGATDEKDVRAEFSNFGQFVDVAAPGANIISTLPENSYGYLSGTSMAAPHVSGMAALVLSRFPTYKRDELFDIVVNSVEVMPFDQPIGRGRIDLSLAVQMDQPLPTARIAVAPTISGFVDVTGTASGTSFKGYSVSIGSGRSPADWIHLGGSDTRVLNSLLTRLDSASVPDGPAVVQLAVTNLNGAAAVAQAHVRVFNGLITFPLSNDILPRGRHIVRGTVHGAGKTYELSYGAGFSPTSWTKISSGGTGLIDAVLGEWDATSLPAGYYSLRLAVVNGASRAEFLAPVIFLDPNLKPGWPVHVGTDADFPTAEWRNVRPADLDGDGNSELVLVDAGTRNRPQELLVYSSVGALLWSKTLGFDIPPDLPAIADIDADGKKEIFVDGTNGIVAFHFDGRVVSGWPVTTAARNHAKVVADLDNDGHSELISYSQEYAATQVAEMRQLSIYRHDGTLVRSWSLPWCGFTNDVQKIFPAVANLDTNANLEIVVPTGCSEIVAYNHDRVDARWRSAVVGKILSSPVIGDVDGNGEPDVVVAVSATSERQPGGVYVFDGEGRRWRGWPVLEEYSFASPPALGDLDRDGRLEIVVVNSRPRAAVHVLQWDGFEADGWPLEIFGKTSARVGVSLADLNDDQRPDVLLSVPGYPGLVMSQNDPEYLGGIMAYDFSAAPVPLGNVPSLSILPFESGGQSRLHKAAPLILDDVDNNGRLDLIFASIQDRAFGSFGKFKDRSTLYVWELDLPVQPPEWPMFGHDIANSGAYSLPLSPVPTPTNVTRAIRDRVIVGEDRELTIEPLINDWNATAQALRLVSVTQPTNGVAVLGNGTILYRPSSNYFGPDMFTYTMADEAGTRSTASVFVRVKPSNDAPVAREINLTMRKNMSVDVIYHASDVENETSTFRILNPPQNGEIWNYPGVGNYYPKKGFSGQDTFTYVANDGQLDSLPATVTITILNSNNPPTAISQSLLTKTNRAVAVTPTGTDPDGDPLTYQIVRVATNGSVATNAAGFLYTPGRDFVGTDSFTFRAHDGTALGEEATVTIGVIATNAAPRANNGSVSVQPNTRSNIRLFGSDPDGDEFDYVVLTQPLHGTLSGTAPQLSYLPDTNYLGPDRFEFKVSDGFNDSGVATVTIQVMRQNRAPESKDQTVSVLPADPSPVALNGSDPDDDSLRTVLLKGPRQGTLYGSGTNLTYAPRPGAFGSDSFSYKLWDGHKFGNEARVTLFISPVAEDRSPQFVGIRTEDGLVTLSLNVAAGKPFTIQSSTNLIHWNTIASSVISTTEGYQMTDTNGTDEARFYRALRQ